MENVKYDCIIIVELFHDHFLTFNADNLHPLASEYIRKAMIDRSVGEYGTYEKMHAMHPNL